jgi:hypothetical protein
MLSVGFQETVLFPDPVTETTGWGVLSSVMVLPAGVTVPKLTVTVRGSYVMSAAGMVPPVVVRSVADAVVVQEASTADRVSVTVTVPMGVAGLVVPGLAAPSGAASGTLMVRFPVVPTVNVREVFALPGDGTVAAGIPAAMRPAPAE